MFTQKIKCKLGEEGNIKFDCGWAVTTPFAKRNKGIARSNL